MRLTSTTTMEVEDISSDVGKANQDTIVSEGKAQKSGIDGNDSKKGDKICNGDSSTEEIKEKMEIDVKEKEKDVEESACNGKKEDSNVCSSAVNGDMEKDDYKDEENKVDKEDEKGKEQVDSTEDSEEQKKDIKEEEEKATGKDYENGDDSKSNDGSSSEKLGGQSNDKEKTNADDKDDKNEENDDNIEESKKSSGQNQKDTESKKSDPLRKDEENKNVQSKAKETDKKEGEKSSENKEEKAQKKKQEEDSGKSQKHLMFENCGNDTEDMRPVAKLLYSLGADLCKQQIYKDLLRVQDKKKVQNKLNEKEEKQLEKLRTAYEDLMRKNKPYGMVTSACKQCNFKTESVNVLEWHMEFAHGQENGNYMCSFCQFETRQPGNFFFHMEAEHNRKGRIYMKQAFYSCALCPFENNSKPALTKHRLKCEKHFQLKRNLEPAPTDCDIPLKKLKQVPKKHVAPKSIISQSASMHRKVTQIRPMASNMYTNSQSVRVQSQMYNQQIRGGINFVQRPGMNQPQIIQAGNNMFTLVNNQGQFMIQPTTSNVGNTRASFPVMQPAMVGQQGYMRVQVPSIVNQQQKLQQKKLEEQKEAELRRIAQNAQVQAQKALQEVLRQQQQKAGSSSRSSGGNPSAQFEICEICGGFVKDRESLRIHFYWAHKVDISKELFDRKQPHLACEHCPQKFWTYQGYSRHRQMKHPNVPAANQRKYACPICRAANIANLLHHFFQVHRITLDMIHKQKKCPMCGGAFKNENMTRLHILNQHRDQLQVIKAPNANKSVTNSKSGTPVPTGLFENNANKKKFEPVCSLCNLTFPTLEAFSYHCNKMHIFKCSRCPQKWSSVELLNEHYAKVHRHESEKCQLCEYTTTIGRPMVRHMKRSHLKECSVIVLRMTPVQFMKHLQKTKARIRILDQKKKEAEAEKKLKDTSAMKDKPPAKKEDDDIVVLDGTPVKKGPKQNLSENNGKGLVNQSNSSNKTADDAIKGEEETSADKNHSKVNDKSKGFPENDNDKVKEVMEVDGETIVIQKEEEMEVDGEKIVIQKQDDDDDDDDA